MEVTVGLLQPGHLILILVIALVIVGPGKIAGLGGALGKTIREFRESVSDVSEGIQGTEAKQPEKKPEA
jgi:sec-independent protein translocase protein TatA